MRDLPNIRRAMNGMRWAIDEAKLEQLVAVVEARSELGRPFTAEEIEQRMQASSVIRLEPHAAAKSAPGRGGKVAVLPLTGLIVPKSSMIEGPSMPSGTSCEAFAAAFDAAVNDSTVGAIVIDIDSPGGSVNGVPELAQRIHAARGTKPIKAVANGMAASAAYWIGTAADELIVAPSGEVGSIGVFVTHAEGSAMFAKQGIKHTIIKAGEYKAEGNPFEPLSDDAQAAIQADVNEIYGWFVDAVATHRNVGAATVKKNFGKGRCVLAKMAVAAGMADRVATLESVLAGLGVSGGAYGSARRAENFEESDRIAARVAAISDITGIGSEVAALLESSFSENVTALAGVAASAVLTLHETSPAPTGQRHTMQETATASPSGAASTVDLNAALAAERLRSKEIRSLCEEHGVGDANVAESMIERGLSVEKAKLEIFEMKRAEVRKAPVIRGGHDRAGDRPFDSLGEQLLAVVKAGKGVTDPRLHRMAAASGMNESVGSEGGFMISPDFLPEIAKVVFADDPILSRVKQIPSTKNIVKYNVLDETSRATGSRAGGVQVYWAAEADTATAKKPKLRQMVLEKKKIMGLAYLTDELQDDAPAAQALVSDSFMSELRFTIANAVFRGQGSGQPLGFLNSGATASVAIEAAQTIANTAQSIAINTSKMLSRIPASLWNDAIFLYNQELLPKLAVATIGTSGAVPVFMGAGGMSAKPYDTIWGRPAFASELCEAEGTVGDIICLAPSQYAVLGGSNIKFSESVHVRFLYDENTLKFTTRVDGAPEWVSTITRFKGSAALSPFVTLAARS